MDRFTQLAAFVQTVNRGSQAAAARSLGVTPAMVGRYIAALENRLGTRLLNRTTATQSPTEAGLALHARATAILDQLDTAEHDAATTQAEPHGALRVNAPMVFGARYLAAAIAEFGARHPAIRTELVLDDRVVDLVEEGYDLAIRIGRLPDSSLVARRLAPCRTLLCAAPAYLARHGAPTHPAQLRHHNCLLYAYAAALGAWTLTGPDGQQLQQPIAGNLVANNGDALLEAAIAGAGIVLQPTFIAAPALRNGSLVPVLPGWHLPPLAIHAIYPSSRHLAPKVRRLVDDLATRFGGTPPWDQNLPPHDLPPETR
ncbi:MAG: LysR family transcriptional regulator [Janthinobacterium lividum]